MLLGVFIRVYSKSGLFTWAAFNRVGLGFLLGVSMLFVRVITVITVITVIY